MEPLQNRTEENLPKVRNPFKKTPKRNKSEEVSRIDINGYLNEQFVYFSIERFSAEDFLEVKTVTKK